MNEKPLWGLNLQSSFVVRKDSRQSKTILLLSKVGNGIPYVTQAMFALLLLLLLLLIAHRPIEDVSVSEFGELLKALSILNGRFEVNEAVV